MRSEYMVSLSVKSLISLLNRSSEFTQKKSSIQSHGFKGTESLVFQCVCRHLCIRFQYSILWLCEASEPQNSFGTFTFPVSRLLIIISYQEYSVFSPIADNRAAKKKKNWNGIVVAETYQLLFSEIQIHVLLKTQKNCEVFLY